MPEQKQKKEQINNNDNTNICDENKNNTNKIGCVVINCKSSQLLLQPEHFLQIQAKLTTYSQSFPAGTN